MKRKVDKYWEISIRGAVRIKIIAIAMLSLLSATPMELSAQRVEKPNVLFILVDDLGWADMGYTGSKVHETPHVDKLATEGMVLSDFYSGGPVCSPTRASIMTGKATARTGVTTYLITPDITFFT